LPETVVTTGSGTLLHMVRIRDGCIRLAQHAEQHHRGSRRSNQMRGLGDGLGWTGSQPD
jgi:hypothetical protein